MENKFYHSVYLKADRCKGCIHCLKRCPTNAIRVRNGKAHIIKEFCIDCAECNQHCPYHAKRSHRDEWKNIDKEKYKVALVDPSIYGQFNHLHDLNVVLYGFKAMGFDDVFDIAYAYEYWMECARVYIEEHKEKYPIINSTCPAVVRLIRVRFPELLDHLIPFVPPIEIAARAALAQTMEQTGYKEEEIEIVYITPCPAQAAYIKSPIGIEKTHITSVLAMKDIYKQLVRCMEENPNPKEKLIRAGRSGVGVGTTCAEARGIGIRNYVAVDGIENVIKTLEEIEDDRLPDDLIFAELKNCSAGCMGGVLNVENPYIARAKVKQLDRYIPVTKKSPREYFEKLCNIQIEWENTPEFEPVFELGQSMQESIDNMSKVETLLKTLPGMDCGSCGAPTCRALAEDIVRGFEGSKKENCIYLLRGFYSKMQKEEEHKDDN
ncbi:[Fe-Fe] hydrogenase large subunit C-terminal domain-containing protein [Eubacterium oxidoreducens]|uniref:Iron only hydrogenase large subunit, C-terminal domain n=1 Tax=Eubacterium oxidoreducens TaxID=1732 RepID=A0A1G6BVF2_EUBOX|nr:[Fe-Fe] hydrogenase large subunit C-terminal domain-containing protein [Eubacterium oxidoreducens]SDB24580.1 Iron only hydrogenase large subunit, C-terminal domain [Eubacterium oxidoreducens]